MDPEAEAADRPEPDWTPSGEVKRQLIRDGLVRDVDAEAADRPGGGGYRAVTRAGFQFLLRPVGVQVWLCARICRTRARAAREVGGRGGFQWCGV